MASTRPARSRRRIQRATLVQTPQVPSNSTTSGSPATRLAPAADPHPQPTSGPEGEGGVGGDRFTGDWTELETPDQRRKDHRSLPGGESSAETAAGADAERYEHATRERACKAFSPTLRDERFRVVEPTAVAAQDVLADPEHRPFVDLVLPDRRRANRLAPESPDRRVEPERLIEDPAQVAERAHVGRPGPAMPQDCSYLVEHAPFRVGVY